MSEPANEGSVKRKLGIKFVVRRKQVGEPELVEGPHLPRAGPGEGVTGGAVDFANGARMALSPDYLLWIFARIRARPYLISPSQRRGGRRGAMQNFTWGG